MKYFVTLRNILILKPMFCKSTIRFIDAAQSDFDTDNKRS